MKDEIKIPSADQLRLQMGELTAEEVRVAKAAYRLGYITAKRDDSTLRNHEYFWAGEADCPKDIKAPNGELHTLRCKNCHQDDPTGYCAV